MNKNSNTYIIIYATVMVVVVALVLAFASLSLKDKQNANVENEMKGAILLSIGQGQEFASATDKTTYINEQYTKYIVDDFAVNSQGEKVADANAFDLLKNLKAEYSKSVDQRLLPVFVSRSDDGSVRYILPLWGSGLWGPVWGYLALEGDWNTIYGAVFDHKGETPGLGAEIATPEFQDQFKGKMMFSDGQFVSIAVIKGAGSSLGNEHAVDAISGGTITSRGVEKMLRENLNDYLPYINQQLKQSVVSPETVGGIEIIGGADDSTAIVIGNKKNNTNVTNEDDDE